MTPSAQGWWPCWTNWIGLPIQWIPCVKVQQGHSGLGQAGSVGACFLIPSHVRLFASHFLQPLLHTLTNIYPAVLTNKLNKAEKIADLRKLEYTARANQWVQVTGSPWMVPGNWRHCWEVPVETIINTNNTHAHKTRSSHIHAYTQSHVDTCPYTHTQPDFL